eukprot:72268_1
MLQNLVLIPNHQRSLRQHVWQNCSKAINIVCNPLREQYLAEAEADIKAQEQETKHLINDDKTISINTAETKEEPPNNDTNDYENKEQEQETKNNDEEDYDEDDEDEDEEEEDDEEELEMEEDDEEALYKERLIELPFVLDVGFEDKDGFDFYIADPSMKLTIDERKNNKYKNQLKQQWKKCSFIFTNLNTKSILKFELNKLNDQLKISYNNDKPLVTSLKAKTKNLGVGSNEESSTTASNTIQPVNTRQSTQIDADSLPNYKSMIGDHLTFAVSKKGINFFWEEKRSASYEIEFNIIDSW